ncbi:MAG: hypothetical protein AABY01_02025 [Nanoarchaeota archaeon]
MKKLVILLMALVLIACTSPVIVESPGQIKTTETVTTPAPTPTSTPPVVPASTETAPAYETPCGDGCIDECGENSVEACGEGTAYVNFEECVVRCNGYLREQGCKASCAAENTIECGVIFKSECKKECRDACA